VRVRRKETHEPLEKTNSELTTKFVNLSEYHAIIHAHSVYAKGEWACVCVRERERERDKKVKERWE